MSQKAEPDDNQDPFAAGPESAPEADSGAPSADAPSEQAAGQATAVRATVQAELDKMRDQLLRALAETENVRRRAIKEREDASKFAVTGFARDLLDFSDNVRRAIDSIPGELKSEGDERIKNLIAGLEAMEQQMLRTFEKHGIKKVSPINEMFDPHFHEVIFEAPGTGKPAGMVVQVAEPGYTLHGRLLRPARVGVAKADGNGGGNRIDTQA
jgi:molecular chaperone GrpE